MRAIFIFLIMAIFLSTGCATVEVAREVTKVSKSVEESIKKIFEPKEEETKEEETKEEENINTNEGSETNQILTSEKHIKQNILIQKQEISKERKKISNVIIKQQEVAIINLLGKSVKDLNQLIGKPQLTREDGETLTFRFDSKSCRLFVFMNANNKTPRVEYYELRNTDGNLIDKDENIKLCFHEIKPV